MLISSVHIHFYPTVLNSMQMFDPIGESDIFHIKNDSFKIQEFYCEEILIFFPREIQG